MKALLFSFTTILLVGLMCTASSADLVNNSFEDDDASGGDVGGASGWGTFNNVFTTAAISLDGDQSLKTFGPFNPGGGSGAVQALEANPGEIWVGEIWALDSTIDLIDDQDFGVYKIEFLDAAGTILDAFESNPINAGAPDDVWQRLSVSSGPAPAGTVSAQAVIVKVDVDGAGGGSIFWDSASLSVIPEPGSATLLLCGSVAMMCVRRKR